MDRAPLQRQRRFFILMSLALVAYYFLGATPSERAEYSGFGVTLANPHGVVTGLWIIWLWSLWRYAQRVYELASVVWAEFVDDVEAEDHRIAFSHLTRAARKAAAAGEFDQNDRSHVTVANVSILTQGVEEGRSQSFRLERDGSRRYVLQIIGRWGSREAPAVGEIGHPLNINAGAVRWIRIRAWIYAAIGLPAFSEHVAPMLLVIAVPVCALYFANTGMDLHADNITCFWRVHAETDFITFDSEPDALDVSADLKALSASLHHN